MLGGCGGGGGTASYLRIKKRKRKKKERKEKERKKENSSGRPCNWACSVRSALPRAGSARRVFRAAAWGRCLRAEAAISQGRAAAWGGRLVSKDHETLPLHRGWLGLVVGHFSELHTRETSSRAESNLRVASAGRWSAQGEQDSASAETDRSVARDHFQGGLYKAVFPAGRLKGKVFPSPLCMGKKFTFFYRRVPFTPLFCLPGRTERMQWIFFQSPRGNRIVQVSDSTTKVSGQPKKTCT